jgi:transcriptional/translational regulatory protein YebC/TACO1
MNDALEAGAENMETDGDLYVITAPPAEFEGVKKALAKKYKPASTDIAMVPKDWIKVDDEVGRKVMSLLENLDDNEDVQKVYMNAELPETLVGK